MEELCSVMLIDNYIFGQRMRIVSDQRPLVLYVSNSELHV